MCSMLTAGKQNRREDDEHNDENLKDLKQEPNHSAEIVRVARCKNGYRKRWFENHHSNVVHHGVDLLTAK